MTRQGYAWCGLVYLFQLWLGVVEAPVPLIRMKQAFDKI